MTRISKTYLGVYVGGVALLELLESLFKLGELPRGRLSVSLVVEEHGVVEVHQRVTAGKGGRGSKRVINRCNICQ